MDVLHDALAVADLRGRQRVHGVPQVRDGRLAHLLLVRNRCDGELAGLLLNEGEGRDLGFLRVSLAIDLVANRTSQCESMEDIGCTYPIVHGGVPSSWKREASPTQ